MACIHPKPTGMTGSGSDEGRLHLLQNLYKLIWCIEMIEIRTAQDSARRYQVSGVTEKATRVLPGRGRRRKLEAVARVARKDARNRRKGRSTSGRNEKGPHFCEPLCSWCRHQESNPGPTDYKSVALPAELYRQTGRHYSDCARRVNRSLPSTCAASGDQRRSASSSRLRGVSSPAQKRPRRTA